MRLHRTPLLRHLAAPAGPALVGFLRPKILLPTTTIDQLSPEELRLILLHELAHVKRRDVLVNWVATLICTLHWFNPAAWLVLWRMRVERELACDEMVLRAAPCESAREAPGHAYAHTILKLLDALSSAPHSQAPPAGTLRVGILQGREKAQIQRRLVMIARFDTRVRRWSILGASLALILAAAALTGAVNAQDRADAGAPGKPRPAQDTPKPRSAALRPPGSAAGAPEREADRYGRGGGEGMPIVRDANDPASARTREKLSKPVQANFTGTGLAEVIDFIRDAADVDILVDWKALEAAGIPRDVPVELRLKAPTAADHVLELVLRTAAPNQLTHHIDRGVVMIETAEQGHTSMVTKAYDVADLMTPRAPGASEEMMGHGAMPGAAGPGGYVGGGMGVAHDGSQLGQLQALIMQTVQPDSWATGGGQGTIGAFGTKLIIKNSDTAHKEVAELLAMLRDKPSKKVSERSDKAQQ